MVSFKWGNQPVALPDSNDYIETEFKHFITTEDRNFKKTFLYNFKKAINSVEAEKRLAFKQSLKALYLNVLAQPLQPIIERNIEAWKTFSSIGTKSGPVPNESNIKYIKDKTIIDIKDNNTRKRLIGKGGLSYGRNQEDLPEFKFDEWWETQNIPIEDGVSTDLIIRERESDADDFASGRFTYAFKKSSQELDAHFEFNFPPFDGETLINDKVDWLLEETGSSPTPKSTKKKSIMAKENIPHGFVIPDKYIKQLKEGNATNWVLEQEYDEDKSNPRVGTSEDLGTLRRTDMVHIKTNKRISLDDYNELEAKDKKNYESKYLEDEGEEAGYRPVSYGTSEAGRHGKKIILTNDIKDSPFTNVEVQVAIAANPEMRNKSLVKLGDKIYSYHFSKGGKVADVKWDEDDKNSPYDFIKKNEVMFMRMIKKQLTNPLKTTTIRILGNIKTERGQDKTLAREIQSKNYPDKDMGDKPTKEKYTILRHMVHKKTGEKLSFEEYSKLPDYGEKEKDILWDKEYAPKPFNPKTKTGGRIATRRPKDMPKNKKIGDVKEEGKYISGKNDYKAYSSKATLSEIEELSENAFKNKETGDMLSEKNYGLLSTEEKKKYKSAVRLVTPDESETNIKWKDAQEMGQVKHSSGTYTGYTIDELEKAFSNATVECTVEATVISELNLKSIKREGSNREMKSFIDNIKSNIRNLDKKLIGV